MSIMSHKLVRNIIIWLFCNWLMCLICELGCDVWKWWILRFYLLFENNRMLWVQLDAIVVNILIELMFDTWMVSNGGFGVVWIGWISIILLKSVYVELCRFAYSLGEHTRWASLLARRMSWYAELCKTLICKIMQIRILVGWVLLAERAWVSGWASATCWANGWASATR